MAINFNSFTEGTTSNIQSNDYVVGFDNTNPGGERKWTVSTIANAVSGITKNALSDNMYSGGSLGFRNKIINGDAKISQRYGNTVKVASSVDGFGFPVDRFCFTDSVGANWPTNGIITYKRNDIRDLPSFTNSVLLSTSTVGTIGVNSACGIRQSLEGINISDLAWGTSSAQPITVSFWVKSSLTGTHSLVVNGLIDDRTTTRRYASTYNISSTNWEYKSITIPGDTTASTTWFTGTSAAGLNLIWGLGTGTNFQITPGSWGSGAGLQSSGTVNIIANAGATFQFTGVQLEKGSTATPFEHRPIGTELALCQRYYFAFPVSFFRQSFYNSAGSDTINNNTLHVEMRAVPTITQPTFSYTNASGAIVTSISKSTVRVGWQSTTSNTTQIDNLAGGGASAEI
jgi:hypothetical protein